MTKNTSVRLTENVEHNLSSIERFLLEAEAPQAFDALLNELELTVIPNLERFAGIGRPFMTRQIRSVETSNRLDGLLIKLAEGEIREYPFSDYPILYAQYNAVIDLLSIKQHCQLSFDFEYLWT